MSRDRAFGERLLQAAMRCHPPSFRREYEQEMVEYYRAVVSAEGLRHGGVGGLRFLSKCVASAVFTGLAQRFRRNGRAPDEDVADGPDEAMGSGDATSRQPARRPKAWFRGLGERRAEVISTWVQEVRHAARALAKRPGFTAVVVLTLVLGIGANTAVFNVLHAVLLTPLPYEDAEQLVRVYEIQRNHPASANYLPAPAIRDLQETLTRTSSFAALNNYQQITADLTDGDRPQRITVLPVSETYFDVVGQAPVIGRPFRKDELENARVAVVSHRVFSNYLGGAADVLPSTLTVDGTPYTVLGVMPEAYEDPLQGKIDLFIPIGGLYSNDNWDNHFLTTLARLRPGATVDQLNAELSAAAARHREPSGEEELGYLAVPEANGAPTGRPTVNARTAHESLFP